MDAADSGSTGVSAETASVSGSDKYLLSVLLPVPPLPGSLLLNQYPAFQIRKLQLQDLNQYPAFLPTRFPRELIFLPLPWHLSASVLNADLLFLYHFLRHL